jgi:hypothetical protein
MEATDGFELKDVCADLPDSMKYYRLLNRRALD